MRKSLATLIVSLLLSGGAAAAVIAADQTPSKPVKLAMVTPSALRIDTQAPMVEGGRGFPGPARGRGPVSSPVERAARLAQMCQDRYARTAGMLAYQEARLNLNSQQDAAFERWRTVQLDVAKRQVTACTALPGTRVASDQNASRNAQIRPMPPSPVERMTREETMLQQRLADIQAERPALEALYSSLTPAQRERFSMREPGMMMDRRGGFMGNGMRRGPMGRDMRGQGMPPQGGPNGPDRQAPPPPPQP
jgi:hypothetical protein